MDGRQWAGFPLVCNATRGRACLRVKVGHNVFAEEPESLHHFFMGDAAHLKQGHHFVNSCILIGFQVSDAIVGIADAVATALDLVEG